MSTSQRIRFFAMSTALAAVMILPVLNQRCLAQVTTGSISGTVTDTTGAIISGAGVTIKDVETNTVRRVKTNASGLYLVSDLPVGQYEVTVEMTGFATVKKTGIVLTVGAASVQNIMLKVGSATEQVVVQADVAQVETATSELGALVDQRQMRDLPLNGRNLEQLILLAPGVTQGTTQGVTSFYGRALDYSNSGWRPDGEAILQDGADTVNYWGHGTGASVLGTSLGIESIAEFQVLTGTYSAEFGGAGLAINSVSRSGTNQLHGSAYDFLRNDVLDARSYFDAPNGPPPFRRNQFGASLGGPIKKDKTFFFGNYEGLRQQLGETGVTTVPDAAMRAGNLPGQAPITVPAPIQQLLALWPQPCNGADNGNGTCQYTTVGSNPVNEDYWLVRVDHHLSQKDSLFFRFSRDTGTFTDPFPESANAGFIPTWPETDHTANVVSVFEWKRVATSNVVNVVRYSYVRTDQKSTGPTTGSILSQSFPGRADTIVTVTGLGALGGQSLVPFYYIQNKHTIQDQVYWTHGSHDVRFGGSVQPQLNNIRIASFGVGLWNFTSFQQLLTDTPFQLRAPLQGMDNPKLGFHEFDFAMYVQDNWKVRPNLTVNAGVRYEPTTNAAPSGGTTLIAISQPVATSTGFTKLPNAMLQNPSLKLIDPRIGLAYSPFGNAKTVVRAGFGIFNEPLQIRQYNGNFYSPPNYEFVAQTVGAPLPKTGLGGVQCAGGKMPQPVFPFAFQGMPTNPACLAVSLTTGQALITDIPTNMQWNLNLERQLASGLIFNAAYVGSHGTHLWNYRDNNPPLQNGMANDGVGIMSPYFPSANVRVNPLYGQVGLNEGVGSSKYHSLQLSLKGITAKSLRVQLYYTWSKLMSTNDNSNIGEASNGSNWQFNPYNLNYDYGLSSYDVRHNFTGNVMYELPFKKNQFVRGYQVNLITRLHSGPPYNAVVGYDSGHLGSPFPYQRPNEIADPNVGGVVAASPYPQCHLLVGQVSGTIHGVAPATVGNPAHWFNPCAFVAPNPGTLGDMRRNSLIGPGFEDFDLSLSKTTQISERFRVQFRAECFNILNHPNFQLPASLNVFTGTSSGAFTGVVGNGGTIAQTINPGRQLQFGLKFLF
jgi:Carboxypeptidase regulatory-like domain/TonB dependent receptor